MTQRGRELGQADTAVQIPACRVIERGGPCSLPELVHRLAKLAVVFPLAALVRHAKGIAEVLFDLLRCALEVRIEELLHEMDAVTRAALVAVPCPVPALVVEAEPILATAHGARAMPVPQGLGRDADRGENTRPTTLRVIPDLLTLHRGSPSWPSPLPSGCSVT